MDFHVFFLSAASVFDVEIDDTAASNLCNLCGKYKLVLSAQHVTLVNSSGEPVLTWEYWYFLSYSVNLFTLRLRMYAGICAAAAREPI